MNKTSIAIMIVAAAAAITLCTCKPETAVIIHECEHDHEVTESSTLDSVRTVQELLEVLDNMPTGE